MTRAAGLAFLFIGIGLAFVARERADGTRIMPIPEWVALPLYPAVCLIFIAVGAALAITG